MGEPPRGAGPAARGTGERAGGPLDKLLSFGPEGTGMNLAEQIHDYAQSVMARPLDPASSDLVKKRIVDSILVAYGAREAEPVRIARSALLPSSGKHNSTVYFSKSQAAVEVATFLNGCMTRYLDYNDTYLTKKEFAHPSDNIPAVLSLAEALGRPGSEALKATYLAYQVQCSLADAASLRDRGWDHVVYVSVSSTAGVAGLLGLGPRAFVEALNLGINNNIAMRQVRAGELSMWKGCTAANAARNGVFAVLLAKEGMTGPTPIFEGEMAFFQQVTGPFRLDLRTDHVAQTLIKNHPVEYNAMSGVDAALRLKDRVKGEIRHLRIETSSVIHRTIVKDPEKLRPKTRETADHSLPYIVAFTLLYGAPTPDSYEGSHLTDPRILGLIDKMEIVPTPRFDEMYPDYVPIKIAVTTTHGELVEEVTVPKGHYRDPYSWDDLRRKGATLVRDEGWVDELIEAGKTLERRQVSELFEVMQRVGA